VVVFVLPIVAAAHVQAWLLSLLNLLLRRAGTIAWPIHIFLIHSRFASPARVMRVSAGKAPAAMIKQQLPGLPIEVRKTALGSSKPFPTAGEDNAAVDRSVVVMIDLVSTRTSQKIVQARPKKIWAKSTLWKLEVVDYLSLSAVGAAASGVRIRVTNPVTKKELYLAGPVFGGDLDISTDLIIGILKGKLPKAKLFNFMGFKSLKDLYDPMKDTNLIDKLYKRVTKGHMGDVVWVETEPMDLDDWADNGKGQMVTFIHGDIKTPLSKSSADVIILWDIDADRTVLPWGVTPFSGMVSSVVPKAGVDLRVESGTLKPLNDPQDFYFWQDPHFDIVDTKVANTHRDGILLSFPTGKARWHDLGRRQCDDVRQFVTEWVQKVRIFGDFTRKIEAPPEAVTPTP
jgi:hypothetical protein